MEAPCIYTGPDGTSRLTQVKLPVLERIVGPDGRASFTGMQGSEGWGISVGSGGDGGFGAWHNSPPLLSIVLAGEWEVEIGTGERRVLGAGSITVFCDDSGQGHRSRLTVPETGCTVIGIRLDAASLADLKAQIGQAGLPVS